MTERHKVTWQSTWSKAAHIPDSSALEHGTTVHIDVDISDVCMPDIISGMHTCVHLFA